MKVDASLPCLVASLFLFVSCGEPTTTQTQLLDSTSTKRAGYVDIMEPSRRTYFQNLMPTVTDFQLQRVLLDPNLMYYDAESMIPGYQDSMGDPEGMRPNTIQSILIDLAVPGGWSRLFKFKGRFNFPFGTGGADLSDNLVKINFWMPPRENGNVKPVAYWRLPFSRWRWLFPKGTILGEVLLVKFPSGKEHVFEIRTRKRTLSGWENRIYRPFASSLDLAARIKQVQPEWRASQNLRSIVSHLEGSPQMTSRTLASSHYRGSFATQTGIVDLIPNFQDEGVVAKLLTETPFQLINGKLWRSDTDQPLFGPSSAGGIGITARDYNGGMLEVTDESCHRCHDQAGRSIRDFHEDLVAYGELWGEDETFSWHPFESSAFVQPNGDVANFNNDNRRVRSDFAAAGLVERYEAARHSDSWYRDLPRTWTYRPILSDRR